MEREKNPFCPASEVRRRKVGSRISCFISHKNTKRQENLPEISPKTATQSLFGISHPKGGKTRQFVRLSFLPFKHTRKQASERARPFSTLPPPPFLSIIIIIPGFSLSLHPGNCLSALILFPPPPFIPFILRRRDSLELRGGVGERGAAGLLYTFLFSSPPPPPPPPRQKWENMAGIRINGDGRGREQLDLCARGERIRGENDVFSPFYPYWMRRHSLLIFYLPNALLEKYHSPADKKSS